MIGDRIRTLREQRSWTQAHLADASGVSLRTIQRLETLHSCSPETLLALAAALDVDVRSLTEECGSPARPIARSPAAIAAIAALTLPAVLFVAANMLRFGAGEAGLYDLLASLGDKVPALANVAISPLLILGGPLAAIALIVPKLLRLRLQRRGRLVAVTAIEMDAAWPLLVLLLTAGATVAVLLGYGFVENFARVR